MTIEFTPFDFSDAHYAIALDITKTINPDEPPSEKLWRHYDNLRQSENRYWFRYLGFVDGKPVGTGYYCETWWNKLPDQYQIRFSTLPDEMDNGYATAFYEMALEKIRGDGRTILEVESSARDDKPKQLQWFADMGFVEKERYPRSELQFANIDPTLLPKYQNRMLEAGITIQPLSELIPIDPAWKTKLWELDWILEQDEPNPDPPTKKTLEEFVNSEIDVPDFKPELWMMATDAELHYAGLSVLWPDAMVTDRAYTGWTGVDRPFRRKGVATALKLHAFEQGKAHGITHTRTDNHEDNHMYQINLMLGFKPIPAVIEYVKKM